jgi:cytochrome P450
LGSLPEARRDPLGFVLRVSAEYGDIVHIRLATLRVFLLNRPADIERVLVADHHRFAKGRAFGRARRLFGNGVLTSDGYLHERQRRLMQPAFQRARMSAYGEIMASLAARQAARWRSGEAIDMAAEMSRLTLAIAATTLFGADAAALVDGVGETLETATSLLEVAVLPLAAVSDVLPLPHVRRLRAARAGIDRVLDEIVERRRRDGRDTGDLLSMLIGAPCEAPADRMSDRQLRDELRTLLLAGHETTANALAFTWHLLATHPDVEANMHAEMDAALGSRMPGAADLPALPYTRMVFAESMRLFPPAWLLGRVALEDHEACGHVLPAGSIVVLSPWAVHRNPAFFPDPERFDPGRWRPEQAAARPRFSYFPFGGGARGCLGEAFAWMEGVLVLATLARRLQFRLADASARLQLVPAITLKPKDGVRMTVEARLRPVAARSEEVGERART